MAKTLQDYEEEYKDKWNLKVRRPKMLMFVHKKNPLRHLVIAESEGNFIIESFTV